MSYGLESIRLSAIVPTLGRSPLLGDCLDALRQDGGTGLEILLVAPKEVLDRPPVEPLLDRADHVLATPTNIGFAAANNRALGESTADYVATVNDDAVVEPGWCSTLLEFLDQHPRAAAVQGVVVRHGDPTRLDGCGLAWNRWWQAVQIGHGQGVDTAPREAMEIYGVSATVAIYRRSALEALDSDFFDEGFFAYYEDVDLAGRLRAAGWESWLVPTARAHHAGSLSGRRLPWRGQQLIYGNRHRVLRRLLGRGYRRRFPRILLRDGIDLVRCLARGDGTGGLGILGGWWRAFRDPSPRRRAPGLDMKLLERFVE